ncbi:MAG: hypothetical protein QG622_1643 [Actinomycetota bacterium]|nr:hypothetical protein [Actinomycetota bacterium]
MRPVMATISWQETTLILGFLVVVLLCVVTLALSWLLFRRTKLEAGQASELRQLLDRFEQLAEDSLDLQKRTTADLTELKTRTDAIERILRTVE